MMAQSLIAVLVLVALYLVWSQRRDRLLGGLPAGDLIAADNSEQECPVLLSPRSQGQTGRSGRGAAGGSTGSAVGTTARVLRGDVGAGSTLGMNDPGLILPVLFQFFPHPPLFRQSHRWAIARADIAKEFNVVACLEITTVLFCSK
jgi:hypothetical protein